MDLGWSYGLTSIPATVYKVNSSGVTQWQKSINLFQGSEVIQTTDNGYKISGYWLSNQGIGSTGFVTTPTIIKMDSEGNIQSVENYSTLPSLVVVPSDIRTSDGGFVYWQLGNITKTDSENKTQWVEQLNYNSSVDGTEPLFVSSVLETSDGGLVVLGIGYSEFDNYRTGNIYLIKLEPFLPLPVQPQFSVEWIILVIVFVVITISLLLLYRSHRKTANSKQ